MARQERTLAMMEGFMDLHNGGSDIRQIAIRFNVSQSQVYYKLDEIAKKAGVSRESLLEKPFTADHSGRKPKNSVGKIDREGFNESVSRIARELRELQRMIDKTMDIMQKAEKNLQV